VSHRVIFAQLPSYPFSLRVSFCLLLLLPISPNCIASEMADSVRRRKPEKAPKTKKASATEEPEPLESEGEIVEKKPPSPKERVQEEDESTSVWVDVLRVITFLFLASCGLSYLISAGETYFWGMKNPPNYLTTRWWKLQIVGSLTRPNLNDFAVC